VVCRRRRGGGGEVGDAFCGGSRPLWWWCSAERGDGVSVFLTLADPRIYSHVIPFVDPEWRRIRSSNLEKKVLGRSIAATTVVQGVGSSDLVVQRLPSCRGATSHPRHRVEQWQRRATRPFWPPAWSGSGGPLCKKIMCLDLFVRNDASI
jgi:hypothetical protein